MAPSPRDVLLTIEDSIDEPAHYITERLADKALAALDAAGYVIVPKALSPVELIKTISAMPEFSRPLFSTL